MSENSSAVLFAVVEAARKTGEAEKLWVRRCPTHGCWQVGAWTIRDRVVVARHHIRLGAGMAERWGLPRVVPDIAWLAQDVPPGPVLVGCPHQLHTVHMTTEPEITSEETTGDAGFAAERAIADAATRPRGAGSV